MLRSAVRSDATPSIVVALASFAIYGLTVCPTIFFGDGAELIAGANCLGVVHPPGYPLYTLLGWLALRVPLGEPALRMNLLSSLFAALACGAACWLVVRLTGSRFAGIVAGLGIAVSSTFWEIATVTEVYSLHLFLLLLLLCAATVVGDGVGASQRGRALVVAGVSLGLGLAHHPTIVLALPAAIVLALPAPGPRRDSATRGEFPLRSIVAASAATLLIPAALYASLLLRSHGEPAVNWGRLATVADLLRHATAVQYRYHDLGWSAVGRLAAWRQLGDSLLHQFNLLALPLALLGLVGCAFGTRRGPRLRAGLALFALALPVAVFGLRYDVSDIEVFLLPLFVCVGLAAGLGTALLLSARARALRIAAMALCVVWVGWTGIGHVAARNLHDVTAARDYARDVLATVPPSGVLFVESDDAFGPIYLMQVLGERGDVTVFDRMGNLSADLSQRSPLPPLAGESGLAHRARVEQSFLLSELSRPSGRSVQFLGWPGYDPPPSLRLEPVGLLTRVRRATDPVVDIRSLGLRYHEPSVVEQVERTGDPTALGFAATYAVSRGERALFEGRVLDADRAFAEAGDLAVRVSGIHSYIGTVYGRYGLYDRAVAALRRAVSIEPSNVAAWDNLGLALELSGDRAAARDALALAREIAPQRPAVWERIRRLATAR